MFFLFSPKSKSARITIARNKHLAPSSRMRKHDKDSTKREMLINIPSYCRCVYPVVVTTSTWSIIFSMRSMRLHHQQQYSLFPKPQSHSRPSSEPSDIPPTIPHTSHPHEARSPSRDKQRPRLVSESAPARLKLLPGPTK